MSDDLFPFDPDAPAHVPQHGIPAEAYASPLRRPGQSPPPVVEPDDPWVEHNELAEARIVRRTMCDEAGR